MEKQMSRKKYHTNKSSPKVNHIETLNRSEFNRWSAFLIGLDKIEERCRENGINFCTLELKPPAIKRYIIESAPDMDRTFETDIIKKNEDILCGVIQAILNQFPD